MATNDDKLIANKLRTTFGLVPDEGEPAVESIPAGGHTFFSDPGESIADAEPITAATQAGALLKDPGDILIALEGYAMEDDISREALGVVLANLVEYGDPRHLTAIMHEAAGWLAHQRSAASATKEGPD